MTISKETIVSALRELRRSEELTIQELLARIDKLRTIERFDLETHVEDDCDPYSSMAPNSTGEWVRFADVARLLFK